ncbi:TPA: type II toxin-antitoxin system HicB family antitoxin [Legionella pneumophila]|nr:type II toxin-antitoxin system HicB family antitoxin [Legionella pneumophila]HDS3863205.1 type II toxin-antitoxin system HicB family antitoxin [Legionella pneumophila]
MNTFTYPIELTAQPEGGFLVTFPDLPEAITQGDSMEDTIEQAIDCLEEAIANRIEMKLDIPKASNAKKEQVTVSLPATLAAKAVLYLTIRKEKLTNTSLAAKLNCDEKEVRRLLDPHFNSKIPRIEQVLHLLGQRLEVGYSSIQVTS